MLELWIHRAITMGKVAIQLKVLPKSPEIDLRELGERVGKLIQSRGELYKCTIEPIAFGINALVFLFLVEEEGGGTEELEKEIAKVEGVSDVRVTGVTRI
jgi:elongation factor 1-beta